MTDTANATTKDTISVLNDLISTCVDGVEGFRSAADAVKDSQAKMFLQSRVRTVATSEAELTEAVRRLGGNPVTHGHAVGSVHRGWINLKSAITGKNDDSILAEAIRGEEGAVDHYRGALKKTLPPDVRALVESQLRGVEENLEQVRELAVSARSGVSRESTSAAAPRSTDVPPTI
jgi:uncharacterized protein (TIGR02284 family)